MRTHNFYQCRRENNNKKMSTGFDDITNDSILYELLEYLVRKQEPELLRCKNDAVPTTLPNTGSIKNAFRYFNNRYSLPESISQRVDSSLPWKLAVGDGGRIIAILQENLIEIRKAKDEYSSLVGKAMVPKDAFPHWRKLSWNPDGSILVLGCSNGYVCFYNSLGNNIFNINPKQTSPNTRVLEAGDAIASMVFLKAKNRGERWTDELLLVTYGGVVKSFCVSGSNGYLLNYEHSFANTYRNGVNCVEYDEKHNLLIVAGNTVLQTMTSPAAEIGLTAWRVLNDYPYFKLSVAFEENSDTGSSKFSLWNYIPRLSSKTETYMSKIRISPNGDRLVALHTDGTISLWNLPHLNLQRKWPLTEQPEYNIPNPLNAGTKVKRTTTTLLEYHSVDVGWWSNDSIIISRYSGSISVCSIDNLRNRLGTSPEFLSGQSQISELSLNHGFLCLDCEVVVVSKKRNRKSSGDGNSLEASSESEVEEDEETDGMSVLNYTTSVIQNAIYSITDIEQFQPKRRKSRVMFRTYRILGLKSTTPEELYSRKIEFEEYEEALALANTYNLDTDLVYQTQWRKSEFSVNAIREHLSKVSKRSWLLQECVVRVPETIEAARELLRFGLRGANLETFLAIANHDDGKFVFADDEDWGEQVDASENLRKVQTINEILSGVTPNSLTESQKDLVRYRRQLLDHLDKLQTYELILRPSKRYDKTVYEEFRKLTVVENAVKFAKEGDCSAVDKMLRYHGRKLRRHWLAILSFFPETLNPLKYRQLLPECDNEGQLYLLPQEELRRQDWSEHAVFADIMSDFDGYDGTEANFIYEMDPSLVVYRNDELHHDLIRGWYESRARQIEKRSFMVDNAVELIKIGVSHRVRGLEGLLFQLEVLEDLVYKVYLMDMTLTELEKLTDLEKVQLLMNGPDERNFVGHLKLAVLPFLKRKQNYLGGPLDKRLLRDYLVSVSKESLKLSAKLFVYLKQTRDAEIFDAIEDLTSLALDCLYSCVDLDLYQEAKGIFDAIRERGRSKTRSFPSQNLDELERELESIRLFNLYRVKTTLKYLKEHKHDPEASKLLLVEMARNVTKRIPAPDEKLWAQLLNDILEIHSLIFMCLDVEKCFEICVAARLSSGVKSTVQNCANLIETRRNEESLLKVSYPRAVELILEASQEYFNTSKSLSDFDMELAKTCLNLIVDDNAQIKEEYELIKSLEILREFHVDILPLQVRLTQDRLKLIELCLNTREDTYKSRQRLLTLASHLGIEKSNSRVREGKVLELIAIKAFEARDYKVCSATCANLMENNYLSAWRIVKDLGYCEHFQDLEFRRKCLWFVVNNGTNEIIREVLQQLHLIEVQILNSEIQVSMPIPEEEEDFDLDSEDDFTDAVTTPQVETKEFVPKILESSTELVRNSAQLMKQSTLGLVQNVKSKLRLHSSGSNNDSSRSHSDQETGDAEETSLQSFPCFYETVHESCNVSYLDTDYTRYSKQEVPNKRLKLCQTLIRLALLSETSCCGLEISDISHLFLECAKYTLHADCLLGLSYLFGTFDNAVENVQTLLMELPQTDLYLHILAYYYSLERYKRVYEDTSEIYHFDPMDLIRKVMEASAEEDDALRHLRRKLAPRESPEVERGMSFESAEDNNPAELDKNSGNEVFRVQEAVAEESGWSDNDWGDFPDEFEDKQVPEDSSHSACERESLDSEEERFQALERLISEGKDLDDYENAKTAFAGTSDFRKPEHLVLDKHPVLNLVKMALMFLPRKNHEREILEEVKSLFAQGTPVENDVLREFLRQQDENLTIQQRIHLRLCGDDKTLQEEAVDLVKKNYRDLELEPPVLEELFFKNLTARFSSNHTVYSQIIEHVFMNRTVEEVRENVNVLIEDLMEQKNLPLAVVLLNHLEEIPLSLGTFENSVQLLARK